MENCNIIILFAGTAGILISWLLSLYYGKKWTPSTVMPILYRTLFVGPYLMTGIAIIGLDISQVSLYLVNRNIEALILSFI